MMDLLKKKTTWAGLLMVAKGVYDGVFNDDWNFEVIMLGVAIVTGRHALQKGK